MIGHKNFILGMGVLLLCIALIPFLFNVPYRKLAKTAVSAAGLIGLAVVAYFMFFFSIQGECKYEIQSQRPSPNNACMATVFNRYGGATVNNMTLVSIRNLKDQIDFKANTVLFSVDGIKNVSITWPDNFHLTIRYSSNGGEIFTQLTKWHDIEVLFIAE